MIFWKQTLKSKLEVKASEAMQVESPPPQLQLNTTPSPPLIPLCVHRSCAYLHST